MTHQIDYLVRIYGKAQHLRIIDAYQTFFFWDEIFFEKYRSNLNRDLV